MSERKPEDMRCILKVVAVMLAHGTPPNEEQKEWVLCDGEKCAQWSKGSGLMRCGLRQV